MNQIFGFKKEFKEAILNGIKCYTTRVYTPFRNKCNVGDTMYFYTGIRTKEAEKIGEGIVIGKWRWKVELPELCPIPDIDWHLFSFGEGFDDIEGLKEFFEKDLITYQFKLKINS